MSDADTAAFAAAIAAAERAPGPVGRDADVSGLDTPEQKATLLAAIHAVQAAVHTGSG